MKDQSLPRYLLWAFIPAWILQAAAARFALNGQRLVYQGLMVLVMLVPTLAVLLARIPLKGMGWRPALRGKWKWFFAAWLGPSLLGALGAVLYYLLFPAAFDPSASLFADQLGEEGAGQLAASGLTLQQYMLIQLAAALIYAPFINMIPALGEEIGWRGALYPRLKERFGKPLGRLIGGAIWGAWHWPIMVLAGYEYGLEYWGAPVTGPLLFCLITVAMGTLLDLLYEKTGCIWLPALGHGAINAFAAVPALFLSAAYADRLLLGPLMIGLIGGLPMLLAAAAVLLLDRKPAPGGSSPES